MRCGFKLTAICAADAAIYEPRCPERRLPTKSRARTQATSRAAIRLRRRSPSCALAPILPVRRSFSTGRPGRTREEAGCWKPLSTPGTRIPRIFRRSRRPAVHPTKCQLSDVQLLLKWHFLHSLRLVITQETVQPLGIHQCYRRGDFRSSRDSPEITRGHTNQLQRCGVRSATTSCRRDGNGRRATQHIPGTCQP